MEIEQSLQMHRGRCIAIDLITGQYCIDKNPHSTLDKYLRMKKAYERKNVETVLVELDNTGKLTGCNIYFYEFGLSEIF